MKARDSLRPGAPALQTRHPTSPDAIDELASDWLVRSYAGLSAEERIQLHCWLDADARHRSAYSQIESAWTALNRPRQLGEGVVVARELTKRRAVRRRRLTFGFASMGLAAVAAMMVTLSPKLRVEPAMPATVVVKPDRRILPDGSTLELNAGADVAISFSARQRDVKLLRGEVLFAVAKDANRPFVVSIAGVAVRAVGTAFAIRYDSQQVDVLVTEGKVAVEPAHSGALSNAAAAPAEPLANTFMTERTEPRTLVAGQRVAIPIGSDARPVIPVATQVTTENIERALAWRARRIEFTGTALSDAVALLNRQNRTQLAIVDHALNELQITGIFWSDEPEGFARALEAGMDVMNQRTGDTIYLRRR